MAKNKESKQVALQEEAEVTPVQKPAKVEKNSKQQPANKKKSDKKKKKEYKPSKIKGFVGELKNVTWPSFLTVVKKTGVVLAVMLIFLLVLFGFDRLLSWLFSLLIGR